MSQDHSDHATNAAVDQQSSVETPFAAESVNPSPLAGDVSIDTDTVEIPTDHERARPRTKPKSNRRAAGKSKSDSNKAAQPSDTLTLSKRLLAPFVPPRLALDRQLVPPPLLEALDAAGLATPELLAPATFMTLATIGAVAGPNVSIELDGDGRQVPSFTGLSLRVAALTDERCPSVVPAAILGGAFAVENDALGAHQAVVERHREQSETAARRRALHRQAMQAAASLGIEPPPLLVEDVCVAPGARPRVVLPGGTCSAIRAAAAGGIGILVINDKFMPSMTYVAGHYDEVTAAILNTLSLGHAVPVPDPHGRTMMRRLPAGVIGVLSAADCASLHKAHRDALVATVFVATAPYPVGGDSTPLVTLMRRVHAIGHEPLPLQLSAKGQQALASAAEAWRSAAVGTLPPLSEYAQVLPDLAARLAAGLHLATAAGSASSPGREIPLTSVKHALRMIDTFVMPMATGVLSSVSIPEVERDARRVIEFLRETTSPVDRVLERRVLVRAWQRTMNARRLDAALAILQQAGVLIALDKDKGGPGGKRFEVAAEFFGAS